jgi:hypothetical protein
MVDGYLDEVSGILEGFEHWTHRSLPIDRALDVVVEDKPQAVRRHNRD